MNPNDVFQPTRFYTFTSPNKWGYNCVVIASNIDGGIIFTRDGKPFEKRVSPPILNSHVYLNYSIEVCARNYRQISLAQAFSLLENVGAGLLFSNYLGLGTDNIKVKNKYVHQTINNLFDKRAFDGDSSVSVTDFNVANLLVQRNILIESKNFIGQFYLNANHEEFNEKFVNFLGGLEQEESTKELTSSEKLTIM